MFTFASFPYIKKILLFGCGGIIIFIIAWYAILYRTLHNKQNSITQEINALEKNLKDMKTAPGEIEKLMEEIELLNTEIAKEHTKIRPRSELLQISEAIAEKATSLGLDISRIIPEKENVIQESDEEVIRIPIQIWLSGEYVSLGRFIESLEDLPFLVRSGSFQMSSDDDTYPFIDIYLTLYVYLY